MENKGRLIILEGLDGAGKTTQQRNLISELRLRGVDARAMAEPGGTPLGMRLREMLLLTEEPLTPEEMLLAFTLQRTHLVLNAIKWMLDDGITIVSDRSIVSTMVYQVQAGCTVERVLEVSRNVLTLLESAPIQLFILDISPELARERALQLAGVPAGGEKADTVNHFDEAGLDVYRERRELYLGAPAKLGWGVTVVDGEQSREAITAELLSYIEGRG
jgi:dTMP kinase